MSIKYIHPTINTILEYVDQELWSKVAVNKLDKIKKPYIRDEAHKLFRDFQLMQGSNTQHLKPSIRQQIDQSNKLYERNIGGCSCIIRDNMSKSYVSESIDMKRTNSKISSRRFKRQNTKVHTQGPETINKSMIEPLDSKLYPLYISEPNQQELIKDNQLRNVLQEKIKFYEREQQLSKTKYITDEERFSQQKKKLTEGKSYTYDYEGRILPVKGKNKEGKIRVFTINTAYQSPLTIKPKVKPSPKVTTIQNKRVVASRSKTEDSQQIEFPGTKFAKTVPIKNIIDIFKQDMELGVSFTDLSQNSTFHGRNKNQNLRNSLKLSEYKMNNKSSFKPRMHSEGAQAKRQIFKVKKHNIDMQSDAESKSLSSSLCRQAKSIGKISKNLHVYSEMFGQLE